MGSNLSYASSSTPSPGLAWLDLSADERQGIVASTLAAGMPATKDLLAVTAAKEDGQVIVNLLEPLSAAARGTLLLDTEAFLKDAIDPALVLWLEALEDRSSLRNLRGIEVKA